MAEDADIALLVRVNPPPPPLHAESVAFMMSFGANELLGSAWHKIETVYRANYGPETTVGGVFSRMKNARDADLLATSPVRLFYSNGQPLGQRELVMEQYAIGQPSPIPPKSNLRPADYTPLREEDLTPEEQDVLQRKRMRAAADGVSTAQGDVTTSLHPGQRGDEVQARDAQAGQRVDKDGFKIPEVLDPDSRKRKRGDGEEDGEGGASRKRKRGGEQGGEGGASQATVLVQDSQAQNGAELPRPRPRAMARPSRLNLSPAFDSTQTPAFNPSSPAEAAAARVRPGAPQARANLSSRHGSARTTTHVPSTAPATTLPTPPLREHVASGNEAPTSAQRPRNAERSGSERVQPFTRQADPERLLAEVDPIEDEVEGLGGSRHDPHPADHVNGAGAGDGEDDDDENYVSAPEGGSPDDVRSRSAPGNGQLHLTSGINRQITTPHASSAINGGNDNSVQPQSRSAFANMAGTSTARAQSSGYATGKWKIREDKLLLRGMRQQLNVTIILKKYDINRSESAARNRRIAMLKLFPDSQPPTDSDWYEAPEDENADDENAAAPSSSQRQPWTQEEIHRIRRGIAGGFEAIEIKQNHFGGRSVESVSKKMKELTTAVLGCEQSKPDWPRDHVDAHGWTGMHNLKLRRAVKEVYNAHDAWQRFFTGFSKDQVRQKMRAYRAQMTNAEGASNNASTSATPGVQPTSQQASTQTTPPRETPNDVELTQPEVLSPIDQLSSQPGTQTSGASASAGDHNTQSTTITNGTAQRHMQVLANHTNVTPNNSQSATNVVNPPQQHNGGGEQLIRNGSNGGQTQLNFARDKGKGRAGPAPPSTAELDRQYGRRTTSRTATNASPPSAQPQNDENAAQVAPNINSDDFDEFYDVTDDESRMQRQIDSQLEGSQVWEQSSRDQSEAVAVAPPPAPAPALRDAFGRFGRQDHQMGTDISASNTRSGQHDESQLVQDSVDGVTAPAQIDSVEENSLSVFRNAPQAEDPAISSSLDDYLNGSQSLTTPPQTRIRTRRRSPVVQISRQHVDNEVWHDVDAVMEGGNEADDESDDHAAAALPPNADEDVEMVNEDDEAAVEESQAFQTQDPRTTRSQRRRQQERSGAEVQQPEAPATRPRSRRGTAAQQAEVNATRPRSRRGAGAAAQQAEVEGTRQRSRRDAGPRRRSTYDVPDESDADDDVMQPLRPGSQHSHRGSGLTDGARARPGRLPETNGLGSQFLRRSREMQAQGNSGNNTMFAGLALVNSPPQPPPPRERAPVQAQSSQVRANLRFFSPPLPKDPPETLPDRKGQVIVGRFPYTCKMHQDNAKRLTAKTLWAEARREASTPEEVRRVFQRRKLETQQWINMLSGNSAGTRILKRKLGRLRREQRERDGESPPPSDARRRVRVPRNEEADEDEDGVEFTEISETDTEYLMFAEESEEEPASEDESDDEVMEEIDEAIRQVRAEGPVSPGFMTTDPRITELGSGVGEDEDEIAVKEEIRFEEDPKSADENEIEVKEENDSSDEESSEDEIKAEEAAVEQDEDEDEDGEEFGLPTTVPLDYEPDEEDDAAPPTDRELQDAAQSGDNIEVYDENLNFVGTRILLSGHSSSPRIAATPAVSDVDEGVEDADEDETQYVEGADEPLVNGEINAHVADGDDQDMEDEDEPLVNGAVNGHGDVDASEVQGMDEEVEPLVNGDVNGHAADGDAKPKKKSKKKKKGNKNKRKKHERTAAESNHAEAEMVDAEGPPQIDGAADEQGSEGTAERKKRKREAEGNENEEEADGQLPQAVASRRQANPRRKRRRTNQQREPHAYSSDAQPATDAQPEGDRAMMPPPPLRSTDRRNDETDASNQNRRSRRRTRDAPPRRDSVSDRSQSVGSNIAVRASQGFTPINGEQQPRQKRRRVTPIGEVQATENGSTPTQRRRERLLTAAANHGLLRGVTPHIPNPPQPRQEQQALAVRLPYSNSADDSESTSSDSDSSDDEDESETNDHGVKEVNQNESSDRVNEEVDEDESSDTSDDTSGASSSDESE